MKIYFKTVVVISGFIGVLNLIIIEAKAQEERAPRPGISVSQPLTKNSPTTDDPIELEYEDVRVKAIEQRIGILKEIMARKHAAAEAAASRANLEAAAADKQAKSSDSPDSTNLSASKEGGNVTADLTADEGPALVEQPSHPERSTSPLEGIEIATSPLNSMELANSLFVTGRYAQALKGYEALLSSESEQLDRDWLRCLTANCYRILGQLPEAEKLYREVVSSKRFSYPADHSKWYLDHLTRRKQLQAQMQAIHSELGALSQSNKN